MQEHRQDNQGPETAIIILAAGGSSRMGSPKQLLGIGGTSLISRLAGVAITASLGPVLVVLGANSDQIREELRHLDIHFVFNEEWSEGIASSIRSGFLYLQQNLPEINAAIVMLADQPLVDVPLLRRLATASQDSGHSIITCDYGSVTGPPTLFKRNHFKALLELHGDEGAKKVVIKNPASLGVVPFAGGKTDLDTPGDYFKFLSREDT